MYALRDNRASERGQLPRRLVRAWEQHETRRRFPLMDVAEADPRRASREERHRRMVPGCVCVECHGGGSCCALDARIAEEQAVADERLADGAGSQPGSVRVEAGRIVWGK